MNNENKEVLKNLELILETFDDATVTKVLSRIYLDMLTAERNFRESKKASCHNCKNISDEQIEGSSNSKYYNCQNPLTGHHKIHASEDLDNACENFISKDFDIHPLTVIEDRYSGVYSGAEFTAWNLRKEDVPEAIEASDIPCAEFWSKNNITVGLGNTPDAAVEDLFRKLNSIGGNNACKK